MATTQDRVLSHLKSGSPLTTIEAPGLFGYIQLPVAVHHLRLKGHDIRTKMIKSEGRTYASYSLGPDFKMLDRVVARRNCAGGYYFAGDHGRVVALSDKSVQVCFARDTRGYNKSDFTKWGNRSGKQWVPKYLLDFYTEEV